MRTVHQAFCQTFLKPSVMQTEKSYEHKSNHLQKKKMFLQDAKIHSVNQGKKIVVVGDRIDPFSC